ncbi:hypothetical protein [Octadecabacter sp. R77987]|uniref:hypothetical protein n=1 Tax=Octadecabacter sp. R77987 TaxID=3093874 RepID=UPI0036711AC4
MIKRLWRTQKIALIAFVIALGALGFFGFKTVSAWLYWNDPAHQDQPLAGWMSPRYVAMSYQLPPEVIGPALFLEQDAAPRRISLDRIAAENGLTLAELQARIDAAAKAWRATQEDGNGG